MKFVKLTKANSTATILVNTDRIVYLFNVPQLDQTTVHLSSGEDLQVDELSHEIVELIKESY